MTRVTESYESAYEYCSATATLSYDEEAADETVVRGNRQTFSCPECGRDHVFHRVEEDADPSGGAASGGEAEEPEALTEDLGELAEEAAAEAEPEVADEAEEAAVEALADLDELTTEAPDPTELTVPELREEIQAVEDLDVLEAILDAEYGGDNRRTAIDAIEAQAARVRGEE